MSTWGSRFYGNPCRECGFNWRLTPSSAAALISAGPDRYAEVLDGEDGTAQHPDLTWPVGAYVVHVADNIWIWAERLWSAAIAGQTRIEPFDPDTLATARGYRRIPLQTALWSLSRAVTAWNEAIEAAVGRELVLEHPERGDLALSDVVLVVAHDVFHHEWDIRRSLSAVERPTTT